MDELDVARSLKLDEPPLAGRVQYFPEADRSVIETIRCGILFIMAFWSGPSFTAFAMLKQVLSRLDPSGLFQVVVVDTDGCTDLEEIPELKGQFLHGWGEAAWIREGRVKCTTRGPNRKAFEIFVRNLLEVCAA